MTHKYSGLNNLPLPTAWYVLSLTYRRRFETGTLLCVIPVISLQRRRLWVKQRWLWTQKYVPLQKKNIYLQHRVPPFSFSVNKTSLPLC